MALDLGRRELHGPDRHPGGDLAAEPRRAAPRKSAAVWRLGLVPLG